MMERYIVFVGLTGEQSKKAFAQFKERLRGAEMYEYPVDEMTFNNLYTQFESLKFEQEKANRDGELPSFREQNAKRAKAAKEKKDKIRDEAASCQRGK